MTRTNLAKAAFVLSTMILVFVSGVLVGRFQVFPYTIIDRGFGSIARVAEDWETLLKIRPAQLLQPIKYPGSGVTQFKKDEAESGLTLVASVFDGANELRLLRLDGTVVHRWPVKFFDIFKNVSHVSPEDVPSSEWNVTTHGAVALPDGSVVFNFEYLGTAKLDRCGAVQWTLPRLTNHSLEPAADGGFWTVGEVYRRQESPFKLLHAPFSEQFAMKVSAAGVVEQEISAPGLLFKNNLAGLLFSNGLRGTEVPSEDMTHLNDVQELSAEMASSFPMFAAGDLLLSMRNLNLLMVIDPGTQHVKWHQTGPWLAQHDPDFQPTGVISVFSNNDDRTRDGSLAGGSTILEVNPATGQTNIRYGGTPKQRMFSSRRGDHQYLEHGHVLIDESESGRVFEVNENGEVVWEFINRYDDTHVGIVMSAHRYREDYFTVRDWTCR
jgi:hypothetical protein